MARHTKKQKEMMDKKLQKKQTLRNFLTILPKALLLVALVGAITHLSVMLIENHKAETRMLKQCDEIQGVSKDICQKAFFCARNKVGIRTLDKFDKDELDGEVSFKVAKKIANCTVQVMMEEMED